MTMTTTSDYFHSVSCYSAPRIPHVYPLQLFELFYAFVNIVGERGYTCPAVPDPSVRAQASIIGTVLQEYNTISRLCRCIRPRECVMESLTGVMGWLAVIWF